ncbi:MAG: hypothetical protein ICV67_08070 [Thermoleophilia bacterium]|nr:hypothetical protein [Thermoleophilia bacterium]
MERGANALLAFAATISASLLAAIVLTVITGWGGDDLGAFFFWSVPFGFFLGIVAGVAGRRLTHPRLAATVASALGALAGLLWTVVVALLLGGYFFAFGFPVLLAWMAGGAAGLAAGAGLESPRALRVARIGAYGILGLVLVLLALTPVIALILEDEPDLVAHVRAGTPEPQTTDLAYRALDQVAVVSVTQNDPLVLEIQLADDATGEEHRRVRAWLERSPLVERVDD